MLKFLRGNWITLVSLGILALMTSLAWRALSTPLDPAIRVQYSYDVADEAMQDGDIPQFSAAARVWHDYDYPAPPPLPQDATIVYLSFLVPDEERFDVNYLLVTTTNQDAYLFLEDTLVYSHGSLTDFRDSRGRMFHLQRMDESIAGKRVTILLHSVYRNWIGSLDYFVTGTEMRIIQKVTLADAIYISSLSLAVAMIAFLVTDFIWRRRETGEQVEPYLAGFLLSFLLWTSGTSSFFPRIFGIPELWWELHLIMLYVMPICFAKIIETIVSPRFIQRVKTTLIVYLVLFAVATLTEVFGLDGYMNMLYLFYPVLLASSCVLLHALVRSSWKHQPACRYGTVALVSFIIFGGIDALHWEYHLLTSMLSTTVFSCYAMIPFIFFLMRERMLRDLRLIRQNETLTRERDEAQDEAQRDFLTGAFNRHQLADGIAKFGQLANERGFAFSYTIFDVDHFKTINDTRGHLTGDAVLKQIAEIVHGETDRRHIFIRYGGDEFILLALHYNLDAMLRFTEHLRARFAQTLDGATLSFGISTWHGAGDTMQALMERADQALYVSKEKGRNAVSGENEITAATPAQTRE